MSPEMRRALQGKDDQPRSRRVIIRKDRVKVIPCSAPAGKCIHLDVIDRKGVVIRTDFDHALIDFTSHWAWLPKFHLRKLR